MSVKKVLILQHNVRIIVEDKQVLFNAEDISDAVGYSKVSALDYHVKKSYQWRDGGRGCQEKFITLKLLNKVAKKATRNKMVALCAGVCRGVQERELEAQKYKNSVESVHKQYSKDSAWPFPPDTGLVGIKEAAIRFSMSVHEFSDWLVAEGYATRYASNNSLKWEKWFKDQGYGTRPKIVDERGERESNVAKITKTGLEFIGNRLASQREGSVLSFAKAEATEREKLEKEVDNLIVNQFQPFKDGSNYNQYLGEDVNQYRVCKTDLIKTVKSIVAQIKLKEV